MKRYWGKHFVEKDFDTLRKHYLNYRNKGQLRKLADKMGRTVPLICRKARVLGLTDKENRIKMRWLSKQLSKSAKKRILDYGHPRGMAGKKHPPEAKKKFSEHMKKQWADPKSVFNSQKFKQKRSDHMSKMQANGLLGKHSGISKQGWFRKNGKYIFMRSTWELNYAHYLNFLISIKQIVKWEYESEVFWFNNIKRGVRSYKPDFKVWMKNGSIEYHEVKGWQDEKSFTKAKRMKKYYPRIKIILIDEKKYKAIKMQFSTIIKNWGIWLKTNPNKDKLNPRIEFVINKAMQ